MGIGFAVPVNMARQVMDQLVTHGRLNRGYLGVSVQELTPAVARGLGLPATRGILVADVIPDGPAARAGLKRGDVITAIDGKPVDDVGHFRNLLAGMAPGTKTQITVLRDGRPQTVEIAVGEMPALASAGAPAERPGRLGGAGLTLEAITPETAQKLGLGKRAEGALVVEVEPGGPAAQAGLRPGDVIQEVNRKPVRSPGDFAQAVEQAADKELVVLFNRGGNTAYAVIERV